MHIGAQHSYSVNKGHSGVVMGEFDGQCLVGDVVGFGVGAFVGGGVGGFEGGGVVAFGRSSLGGTVVMTLAAVALGLSSFVRDVAMITLAAVALGRGVSSSSDTTLAAVPLGRVSSSSSSMTLAAVAIIPVLPSPSGERLGVMVG